MKKHKHVKTSNLYTLKQQTGECFKLRSKQQQDAALRELGWRTTMLDDNNEVFKYDFAHSNNQVEDDFIIMIIDWSKPKECRWQFYLKEVSGV